MELSELRPVLIERYVACGYTQERAEAVVDKAFEIHRASIAHRAELSRAACETLLPGAERSDCLGTLLSLEMQHAHTMLCVLTDTRMETMQ